MRVWCFCILLFSLKLHKCFWTIWNKKRICSFFKIQVNTNSFISFFYSLKPFFSPPYSFPLCTFFDYNAFYSILCLFVWPSVVFVRTKIIQGQVSLIFLSLYTVSSSTCILAHCMVFKKWEKGRMVHITFCPAFPVEAVLLFICSISLIWIYLVLCCIDGDGLCPCNTSSPCKFKNNLKLFS